MSLKVVIIWCLLVQNSHQNDDFIQVADDFLKLLNDPIRITTFLTCWDKINLVKFTRKLGGQYFIKSSNLVQIPSLDFHAPEHHLLILDLNCEESSKVLELAGKYQFLNAPFRWLIFGKSSQLPHDNIELNSRIFLVESTNSTLEIVAPYKFSKRSPEMTENSIGKFDRDRKRFDIYNELIIGRNRTNLMGTTLRISYVVTNLDTLQHLWDYRNLHIDPITKHSYILIHHLMDYLNASKEFVMRDTWGYKNASTGIYSGLCGDLQLKLADLGGTPMFFIKERLEVLEYIASPTPTFMRFIFKAPPLSYVTNVYTLPFEAKVWHYSFVMVFILGFCIYLIVFWEWRDPEFRNKIESGETVALSALRPDVFDVLMLQIGAVSQQGSDVEPKSLSGRIATIFTFVVLMFLYTSYSANIVALLQSTTDSIKTLQNLYDSKMKLGAEDLVYQHHYFESERDSLRRMIYEQRIAPKGQSANFLTAQEGIKRVRDEFFAFHIQLSSGYKFVSELYQEHEKCQLREITYINLNAPWLPIPRQSPYGEVFKVGMKKIQESGLQNREFNRIYIKKPTCTGQGSSFQSVGLIDCYSAFLFFVVGLAIALILLILEILYRNYKARKENH